MAGPWGATVIEPCCDGKSVLARWAAQKRMFQRITAKSVFFQLTRTKNTVLPLKKNAILPPPWPLDLIITGEMPPEPDLRLPEPNLMTSSNFGSDRGWAPGMRAGPGLGILGYNS